MPPRSQPGAARGPGANAKTAPDRDGAPADQKRLFLIDGPSLVYRAFFALPESISTPRGVPTNAISRFASMLVMIVTGDRDVFQLIDPEGVIKVMATSRGITDTKIYDREAVIDRYGIAPELIPDFYGLKGDTSDNIPGVPGIGDKTASELIQSYGSLEEVLANVEQISGPKRKQALVEHAEHARVSKHLATAQRDVEVPFDIAAEAAREPDRSRIRDVFREYELRDPLRRLEEALGDPEVAAPAPAPEVRLAATMRRGTPADVAGLGGDDVELCVVAHPPQAPEGELFPADAPWRFAVAAMAPDGDAGRRAARAAAEVLVGECSAPDKVVAASGQRPVIAHDAKALGRVPANLVHDTLLGAYLLDPARRGYPFAELCEERGLAGAIDDPIGAEAVMLAALARWQRAQVAELGLEDLLHEIELPLVPVLREMELLGVRLNLERLAEITARVREEIEGLETEIYALAGEEFLIASPQQLGEILFGKLGLSTKRRGKTGFSTDARVLQAIRAEHEIVPKIERWRELSTLIKTYLDVLPELVDSDSRIHTTFLQAVATTGRLSSTNPNMQNVPIRTPLGREIRGCFEAAPGDVLISVDYSQIELRVLAHVADEPVLREIFERGEDVHTATASQVFGVAPEQLDAAMRSKAKMINYGIVYGLSDYGLADRLNIAREEAKDFIDAYLDRFPRVAAFIEETIERAKEEGFVQTLCGRRRQF